MSHKPGGGDKKVRSQCGLLDQHDHAYLPVAGGTSGVSYLS